MEAGEASPSSVGRIFQNRMGRGAEVRMKDEYHDELSAFFADLVPNLRDRGQHEIADRAERLQQGLPMHDSIAETRRQQRREIFEHIDPEVIHEI